MTKLATRNLYLASIFLGLIGGLLLFFGLQESIYVMSGKTTVIKNIGHPALIVASSIVFTVAVILSFVAWLGALIKAAQLHRWGWFVCLLLFSEITLLLYIFWGPTMPAPATQTVTTPPAGDFGD